MVGAADPWVLSSDEFRILWESEPVRAPFPAGFSYGSSRRFCSADDARRKEQAIEKRLSATTSPMKSRALTALCRPRFSIGVVGAALGHDGRRRPLRIHSGWRTGEKFAFVAAQRLGDVTGGTAGNSGASVAITGYPFSEWASALVAALPPCPGKGRLPNDTDVAMTVERMFDTPVRVVSPSAPRSSAAAAFVHLEPVMGAVFTVAVGSLADGHTPTSMDVHIADVRGDGRYAMILDRPTVAAGVDSAGAARMLSNLVNGLRDRHDARMDDR